MKSFSLLRAMFSQDMNLLAYHFKTTDPKNTWKRFLLSAGLVALIMFAVGGYFYGLTDFFASIGAPELSLIGLVVILTLFGLFEGIYKVQGILFECKDNDLLFSLPVSRQQIFALRVVKLLTFQIVYNALFMIPAVISYAITMNPAPVFYLISIVMLFLIPLIPTAISIVIGYIIKNISIKFRHQKLFQIILTFSILALLALGFSNTESIETNFTNNSGVIGATISQIYYPAGAYARLATKFDFVELLKVIAISVIPIVVAIYLCSIRYLQVISKSSSYIENKKKNAKIRVHKNSKTMALIKKEIGRIFASPVLVVNSLVSPMLLIITVVIASLNLDGILATFSSEEGTIIGAEDVAMILPLFYIGAVILMAATTCVTSSLISLEGKSFNITKSLPVSAKRILISKLLASLIISVPLFIIADLIFVVRFNLSLVYTLAIIILPILILSFSGITGLLINLKHPKMDATNETEVVKQSTSSFLAVLIGVGVGLGSISALIAIAVMTNLDGILIITLFYLLIDLLLFKLLSANGAKAFRRIEV